MELSAEKIQIAVNHYKRQLENNRQYQSNHKEENRARASAYFKKIKNDPVEYPIYLEKKRLLYQEKKRKQIEDIKEESIK